MLWHTVERNRYLYGYSKSEFKTLPSLASKESSFSFNEGLHKQKGRVAMRSHLGPTLANAFLSHYEKIWLQRCPHEIKHLFYRRYVDDIFVLFESIYFSGSHPNMSFSHEVESDGKLSWCSPWRRAVCN